MISCCFKKKTEYEMRISDGSSDVCSSDLIAREEQSHSRTIDERDAAEKALSDAYAIVTGRPPEWSNHFGYKDALDEMADALAGTAQETAWQPTHRHYKGGLIRVQIGRASCRERVCQYV